MFLCMSIKQDMYLGGDYIDCLQTSCFSYYNMYLFCGPSPDLPADGRPPGGYVYVNVCVYIYIYTYVHVIATS